MSHFVGNDEDRLVVVALVDGAAVVPVAHARHPREPDHRILRLVPVVQVQPGQKQSMVPVRRVVIVDLPGSLFSVLPYSRL